MKRRVTARELAYDPSKILTAVAHQTGDGTTRQLGFTLGPLTLDHTDDQLREIIQGGFALAEEKGLAVGFHMDNSMFWMRRSDLWNVHENIEWTDWSGTAASNQEIGWLPGAKLAPQMCWNSPTLNEEVGRITREVIGAEIARGIDPALHRQGASLRGLHRGMGIVHPTQHRVLRSDEPRLQRHESAG